MNRLNSVTIQTQYGTVIAETVTIDRPLKKIAVIDYSKTKKGKKEIWVVV